jgi:hypothetical protein
MSASQVAKGGSATAAEAEGGVEATVRHATGGMLGLWRDGCEGARVRECESAKVRGSEGPRVRGGERGGTVLSGCVYVATGTKLGNYLKADAVGPLHPHPHPQI